VDELHPHARPDGCLNYHYSTHRYFFSLVQKWIPAEAVATSKEYRQLQKNIGTRHPRILLSSALADFFVVPIIIGLQRE
jgi:hypothetical protein